METPHTKKNEATKNKGTVLLRYPMPKYNFQGKKLDKSESEKRSERNVKQKSNSRSNQTSKSFQNEADQKEDKFISAEAVSLPSCMQRQQSKVPVPKNPQSISNESSSVMASSLSNTNVGQNTNSVTSSTSNNVLLSPIPVTNKTGKPVNVVSPANSKSASYDGNLMVPVLPSSPTPTEQTKQNESRLEVEVECLKTQLKAQLQVNSELKRLLLASMGEDLERNVERLARDKAQLSIELGDHMRKITADYENLDKISIQADMWRSKFLASRVMVDELANAKAFYSLQYQESQDALQQLLNERHEIRTNSLEAYKCLQQVKDAFDPFNSHQSISLASTNIIDLAKQLQQLAEVIRYRLLPAGAKVHAIIDIEANWEDRLTPAELLAYEVISKDVNPVDYKYKIAPSLLEHSSTRYHPQTQYDNLTYNCCAHCKGEITLI